MLAYFNKIYTKPDSNILNLANKTKKTLDEDN